MNLPLIHQFKAIGVDPGYGTVLQFLQNLRVSCGVIGIDQVISSSPSHRFSHAVAIPVILDGDSAALHEVVFKVVLVERSIVQSVAVCVVRLLTDAIIGIIVRQS
jgi:hypothetical protein